MVDKKQDKMQEDKNVNKEKQIENKNSNSNSGNSEREDSESEQRTKAQTHESDNANTKKKEDKKLKEEIKKTKLIESKTKKSEAIVNGISLGISTKHAIAVSNFIRNKNIDNAISKLKNVSKFKIAIPMKGEIPHKKGIRSASGSGRYPINAVREFLKLLNSLRANAIYNEMELEKFKIFCMANKASRQRKRFGQGKFKRTHVQIKLIGSGEK